MPRYSDADEEYRKRIYNEDLDKRESLGLRGHLSEVVGFIGMLAFVGIGAYIAYPYLEGIRKYNKNLEAQLEIKESKPLTNSKLDLNRDSDNEKDCTFNNYRF
ncbi:MAG: hypothetical protein Q7S27_00970 [Nanoarchaeota archaeon]|nr:hypothetical protein [Nanoarchaeota archaeon]